MKTAYQIFQKLMRNLIKMNLKVLLGETTLNIQISTVKAFFKIREITSD